MNKSYSFMNIFNSKFKTENDKEISIKKIIIPIIQRDYAQGREDTNVNRIRKRFLQALYNALTIKPITLDFVYGSVEDDGTMILLDGQQRLTTLFLLHWYVAKKENITKEEYSFLENFSYETRYSARRFCQLLLSEDFKPELKDNKLSEEIINQAWFPLDWKNDPTIKSMLVMLDEINEKFKDLDNIWEKLKGRAIVFYFLPIESMGLTDELYIKMNSRGRPLTKFENFKAELENELEKIDKKMSERIMIKIDNQWTDILWDYRDETNSIDEYFLHYFRFICDVICYREDDTPMGKNLDEIDLIKEYFSSNLKNVKENINTFESFFDCWLKITNKIKIKEFFNKYVSNRHEENKIKIDKNIDLFEDCLHNYGLFIENSNRRQFPLGRFVLLYAFIIYLENIENIEEADFIRRIRIINNLINNSVNEISNSNKRDGGNRMPTILKQVDKIILNAQIEVSGENGFNKNQLNEEAKKLIWTKENSEKAEDLYCLEDNDILYGQIDIVGLENYELFNSFNKLFECDWDKIDCALMSIGFYGQESSFARYQLGSSSNITAWSKLFHHGSAKKYENTKQILIKLLESNKNPTNQSLEEIINNYIKKCEEENLYDIRYYYIKYKEFRPGKYGKYYINSRKSIENKPYDLSVMVTEIHVSENSYNPFLKAIDKKNLLSKQYFGQRIINTEYYIISTNEGYILKNNQTDEEIERIEIQQNENKIDKEDRILKCIELENK